MATSFNEQFDQHGAWRREFALRLKLLSEWLKDHDLLDSAVEERLRRLETQMRSDKVILKVNSSCVIQRSADAETSITRGSGCVVCAAALRTNAQINPAQAIAIFMRRAT